ncbi:MAG TPA: hypothetical protein VMU99_01205 [Acidimicrobiales bacterium]|nr:hypothetical protein [Acidimicrobiales bacterium]
MSSTKALLIEFVLLAVLSLFASSRFVIAFERVGARLSLSEAALGLVVALGADSPEIDSSITALVHHQRGVSVDVILGANIFNFAALLGLGAISAGRITLDGRVVVLSGLPALFVALTMLGLEHHGVGRWPAAGMLMGLLIPCSALLESPERVLRMLHLPSAMSSLLERTVRLEERDLANVISHKSGRTCDIYLASVMLIVVVGSSSVMERIASTVGDRNRWSNFVVGGVVLAGVASLPNAVAAIYLALHGRGAATLSTAMHSNVLNVMFGIIVPALFIGVGEQSRVGSDLALWYLAMTVVALSIAYLRRGLGRASGLIIVLVYLVFLFSMIHP